MTDDEREYIKAIHEGLERHLDDIVAPIVAQLREHHQTLYGDGKPGLKSQIQNIDYDLKGHLKGHKNAWQHSINIRTGIIITGIGTLGAAIFRILEKLASK